MSSTRPSWANHLLLFALSSNLWACTKTAAIDPELCIDAESEGMLLVPSWKRLADLKKLLYDRLGAALPAEDRATVEAELFRRLGFDPFEAKGLASAGLPADGKLAASFTENGGLIAFPVKDSSLFKPVAKGWAERFFYGEQERTQKLGPVSASVYSRSFGDEVADVASLSFYKGLALMAFGPESKSLLQRAVQLSKESSMLVSKEAEHLKVVLPAGGFVRLLLPKTQAALKKAMKQARGSIPMALDDQVVEGVGGAAWQFDFSDEGFVYNLRLRLEGEAKKASEQLFQNPGPMPSGLKRLDVQDALFVAAASANPDAFLQRFAPKNSRLRFRVARLLEAMGMKDDEVLNGLSGQGMVALGLGDLSSANLPSLLRNPMQVVWSSIGLGFERPKDFNLNEGFERGLEKQGFSLSEVGVGKTVVYRVTQTDTDFVLNDFFFEPDAVLFSTEPEVTASVIKNTSGKDPLQGNAGVSLKLRVGELVNRLRALGTDVVPVMFRSIFKQVVVVLSSFDAISATVGSTDTGVALDASLTLRPAAP